MPPPPSTLHIIMDLIKILTWLSTNFISSAGIQPSSSLLNTLIIKIGSDFSKKCVSCPQWLDPTPWGGRDKISVQAGFPNPENIYCKFLWVKHLTFSNCDFRMRRMKKVQITRSTWSIPCKQQDPQTTNKQQQQQQTTRSTWSIPCKPFPPHRPSSSRQGTRQILAIPPWPWGSWCLKTMMVVVMEMTMVRALLLLYLATAILVKLIDDSVNFVFVRILTSSSERLVQLLQTIVMMMIYILWWSVCV